MPPGHLLDRDGTAVLQIVAAGSSEAMPHRVRGDDERHLGWWSDRLEHRVPSWLIGSVVRGMAPLVTATVIHPGGEGDGSVRDLRVIQSGSIITVAWQSGSEPRQMVVDRSRPAAISDQSSVARP
jgi:hypothetical protein